ncbi:MAG: terminase [Schwartzia sp.]|nr:terminase [Schwartzia sp. (in: firmicutes)]
MAKDGTNRGGARTGAGRKKKPLADKILEGKTGGLKVMATPADFDGVEMPPVKEFLKAKQKDGRDFYAAEIYEEMWKWLNEKGCASLVNPMLLNQYAMSAGRYIECESINSSMGLLARHPTTGAPIASPYVSMSDMYAKRMQSIWEQIYRVVKENCSVDYQGANPQDDVMERLLRARSGM